VAVAAAPALGGWAVPRPVALAVCHRQKARKRSQTQQDLFQQCPFHQCLFQQWAVPHWEQMARRHAFRRQELLGLIPRELCLGFGCDWGVHVGTNAGVGVFVPFPHEGNMRIRWG